MKYFYLLILSISLNAHADDWFCTDASSVRTGDTIKACGTATDLDENAARREAFNNALHEYGRTCSASSDCQYHQFTSESKRTECSRIPSGYEYGPKYIYQCRRLVVFTFNQEWMSPSSYVMALY